MGSPTRKRAAKRKIAICSFQSRVCPRFDLTREMLIFHAKSPQGEPIEKFNMSRVSPEEILPILAGRKVGVIITGGIQKEFQEMLLHNNIDVIWGVAGEVHDVVEAYMKGALYSGIGAVIGPRGQH